MTDYNHQLLTYLYCFNPCFSGSYIMTRQLPRLFFLLLCVSILVLVDLIL